ncbi:MAG: hypothetical protein B6A08_10120 [Sorangiineae bacterium NIC37A_2]|jgi:transcription elongation GreA/GreB family factor|nr:MAG: hypothetical protein B6A08_10120 [Sorangiineae bacterium NIC37A_2]
MLELIDKQALLDEVKKRLSEQLERLTQEQRNTQAGVVHEDNRAEGDKDMRSTEASYVARGQAARVVELLDEVRLAGLVQPKRFQDSDPIAWGALFSLEDEQGALSHHLLMPGGAGLSLRVPLGAPSAQEVTVTLVSARSPLGQALIGLLVGDIVTLDAETKSREWTLVEVA